MERILVLMWTRDFCGGMCEEEGEDLCFFFGDDTLNLNDCFHYINPLNLSETIVKERET